MNDNFDNIVDFERGSSINTPEFQYKKTNPMLIFLLSLPIIIGIVAVAFTSYAYITSDFTRKDVEAAIYATFEDAGKYDGRAVLCDMFPFMSKLLTSLDDRGKEGKYIADNLADSAILDANPFTEHFKMSSISVTHMETGTDEALAQINTLINTTEKQYGINLGGEDAYDLSEIKYCSGTAVVQKNNQSASFEFDVVVVKCNDKWYVSGIKFDNEDSDNNEDTFPDVSLSHNTEKGLEI